MAIIPDKSKRFVVDNSSFSKGNLYQTFNAMFDAVAGVVKLQHPIVKLYSTSDNADFVKSIAFTLAQKNSGGAVDCYIANDKGSSVGYVWSTYGGSLTKITGSNSPSKIIDTGSDMCLAAGTFGNVLAVTDADGLHYVVDSSSGGSWTLNADSAFQSAYIVLYFQEVDRLYFFKATSVKSCNSSYTVSSGANEITSGISGVTITCARASSRRIWFAASGNNDVPLSKIYEWDGVAINPLNIFNIPTSGIQNIVILNDTPIAIDERGRLWFYDGYQFVLRSGFNLPVREDDFGQTCVVHRNGSFSEGNKVYFLISGYNDLQNSSERGLAGIWCLDPNIGFYHFSSPDNVSRMTNVYALSKYLAEKRMIASYFGSTTSIASANNRISVTETLGGLSGTQRTGFVVTQFVESKNLTDLFGAIATKYREMTDPNATIEVKYRKKKNMECNTTITWTSATTFTCSTADLAGTGSYYNTKVAVGDEVFVQQGVNTGLIAHVIAMSDSGGTTTVTIDRSATTTSGTAYAIFSNFTLLGKIDANNPDKSFKSFTLGEGSTMIQVKVVMSWKGYYDELQEILITEQAQFKPN